jgi:galactose-1-phosphate uridylyltransferase
MPHADLAVVMSRLAALEKQLLTTATEEMPDHQPWSGQSGNRGYVSIIKNGGRLVGGSLMHGHQQIGFSNIMPRKIQEDLRFESENGKPFSEYLQRENPPELLIRKYSKAVLVVPYFMRRPYDMILAIKDLTKRYLYELEGEEIADIAKGWQDAIKIIHETLPAIGREIAYNVITHNGPGAGIYFEFLPYTQEIGGFEHLGLSVCQANTLDVATQIRQILAG